MTPERLQKIKRTLAYRQPDLTVLTDEVHKQHNLSAIIRSCDAFAVQEVNCVWMSDQYRVYNGTAAGAAGWVDVRTHDTTPKAIKTLQDEGFRVCAAHFSDKAIDFRDYDFTQPTALLLGAELEGVSQEAADQACEHLIIPMLGMVQSFNVSVAAALLLSEAQRQRQAAGFFDQCRLDESTYERLYFEWCQPDFARMCQQRKLPYPPLNDEGELADPQAFSALINGTPVNG